MTVKGSRLLIERPTSTRGISRRLFRYVGIPQKRDKGILFFWKKKLHVFSVAPLQIPIKIRVIMKISEDLSLYLFHLSNVHYSIILSISLTAWCLSTCIQTQKYLFSVSIAPFSLSLTLNYLSYDTTAEII